MANTASSGIEHRHLRSALEFAVLMAAEGQKRKPAMQYPKELKPYFNKARLPNSALGRLRRVVETDALFRDRLSAGAIPELVDEIGRLWLRHGDGWDTEAAAIAERIDAEASSGNAQVQLRRAEKRRDAAEQAAVRTRAELLQRNEFVEMQSTEIDDLRAEVAKANEMLGEMKTELIDVRMEVRHARDREAAATARAAAIQDELAAANLRLEKVGSVHDDVRAARIEVADNSDEVSAAAMAARRLAEQLEALVPVDPSRGTARVGRHGGESRRPRRRAPLVLPGGVIATSAEAAGFLVRTDAQFLIDGYNVAKLGWPNRSLEQQRVAILDAVENLSRRFGTDVTVVFDGASIVGAHASRRRLARVMYSPEGVIADDVIRDEVDRLPTSRGVVVVTNDGEIVRDVRSAGANVVPSNAFLAIL